MINDLTQTGSIDLWLANVRAIIGQPTEALDMIDLCCGEMAATQHLKFRQTLHVDVKDCPNRPRGFTFIQRDVLRFKPSRLYDVAICSDGLEHFKPVDGLQFLYNMKTMALTSIIFTPTGEPDSNLDIDSIDPDRHKSAWTPETMEKIGWNVRHYPNWHPLLKMGAMFAWSHLIDAALK